MKQVISETSPVLWQNKKSLFFLKIETFHGGVVVIGQ